MADLTMEERIGSIVAGCDEAGRGSWAGPIVAAAVILPPNALLPGVNDSKSVNKKNHKALAEMIAQTAIAVGVGIASNKLIDEKGLAYANRYVIKKAVENLSIAPHYLLIDGGMQQKIDIDIPQEEIVKGDQKSLSIAAASIIAKAVHDELMRQYAVQYPDYNWGDNAGYGTMEHKCAIKKYGICEYHRRSVKPIKDYMDKNPGKSGTNGNSRLCSRCSDSATA